MCVNICVLNKCALKTDARYKFPLGVKLLEQYGNELTASSFSISGIHDIRLHIFSCMDLVLECNQCYISFSSIADYFGRQFNIVDVAGSTWSLYVLHVSSARLIDHPPPSMSVDERLFWLILIDFCCTSESKCCNYIWSSYVYCDLSSLLSIWPSAAGIYFIYWFSFPFSFSHSRTSA